MNECSLTQLTELCQMVQRGCKLVALMSIRAGEFQTACDIIRDDYNLHIITRPLNESFFAVFIFKNFDLRFIIDLLPEEPKTILDHAVLGFIFGYDSGSIAKYVIENCELNEPNLM